MRAGYTDRPAPKHEPCDPRMIGGTTTHTGNNIFRLVPPSDEEDPKRAKFIDELVARRKAARNA